MNDEIKMYEGNEPYIFVSYCHKDKEQVLPVLKMLSDRNYRIWYDQGIHPGTEWPEIVADKLQKCTVFLVFLSENYTKSKNCIREIHYAVAKEKDFLSIILEPVQLSAGVEMQLCASQAIECRKVRSEKALYQKILEAEVLSQCMEIEEKEEYFAAAKIEDKVENKTEVNQVIEEIKPIKRKKKTLRNVLIILGILVIAVFVFIRVNWIEVAGKTYKRNESFIELSKKTVTAEMIDTLSRFPQLIEVSFKECEFDNEALKKMDAIESLSWLTINSCTGVEDLSFLRDMSDNLRALYLIDMKLKNEDLEVNFQLDNLHTLQISNNPGLTNISNLPDIVPEPNAIILDNNAIENVDVLSEYKELTQLNLNGNQIERIDIPLKSLRLSTLKLADNPLKSVEGLENLTALSEVDFRNSLTSLENSKGLECISKSKETMYSLDLSGNYLEQEEIDGLFTGGMKIEKLYMDDNHLDNLDFLMNNSVKLAQFSAQNCGIKDISGMKSIGCLYRVDLSDNKISDLTDFPKLDEDAYCVYVDLSNNQLTTIDGLAKNEYLSIEYMELFLHGNNFSNEIEDELKKIYGGIITLSYFENMPYETLNSFSKVIVENVPMDQRVKMEDNINGCFFGNLDEDGNLIED